VAFDFNPLNALQYTMKTGFFKGWYSGLTNRITFKCSEGKRGSFW